MSSFRIATRGSPLALCQARLVAESLEAELGPAKLVVVKTQGDRFLGSLAHVGGKGLFVKEIENALLEGHADLAVHSVKDLPGDETPGLVLAAFTKRADPRDALVACKAGVSIETLPMNARVGTGSLRRRSQILAARPDLKIEPMRGNVETRLRKFKDRALDGVVLACAGLDRLGLSDQIAERIKVEKLLPAVGQGTLAVQVRAGDSLMGRVAALDHAETRIRTVAERTFLAELGGDCSVPLAAYAELREGKVAVRGLVSDVQGLNMVKGEAVSDFNNPESAGRIAGQMVLEHGGDRILENLRVKI